MTFATGSWDTDPTLNVVSRGVAGSGGQSIVGTALPSGFDDALRDIMAQLEAWRTGTTLTFGITGSTLVISHAVDNQSVVLTGGTFASVNAARLILLGGTGGSAGDYNLYSGTDLAHFYDHSAVQHTFFGAANVTGQLSGKGTSTNDDASSGYIGEYIEGTASGVSQTTATITNITSIVLPAGDWDVEASVFFNTPVTTSVTEVAMGISGANNTLPTLMQRLARMLFPAVAPGSRTPAWVLHTSRIRVSVGSTTTFYLNARPVFTLSTLTADGFISARRVR